MVASNQLCLLQAYIYVYIVYEMNVLIQYKYIKYTYINPRIAQRRASRMAAGVSSMRT